ncbi:type IV secretion system protein [Pseudozobellia thermophila]|uniref:Uncharacterized protein n=1 Tax=Pseudozobellia thermophila TaxID=192903 RepID=A0A1M6IMX9_9FLAO|nr:type IV secretion system protein [Pseudozobellia thermophila]SHJ35824.1 hypothetical protein SAMN04488513_10453 [Pseudozobellia thermophila]
MNKEPISTDTKRKAAELHWQVQQWKSQFQNLDDQLEFMSQLLDSYIFQTDLTDLSERVDDLKVRTEKTKAIKKEVRDRISRHESKLGNLLNGSDRESEPRFYNDHDKLATMVDTCTKAFQDLKSEVFSCGNDILKKRRS